MVLLSLLAAATAAMPPVQIVAQAPFVSVEKNMTGSYDQHAAAARQLLATAQSACSSPGVVYGEYPEDPDVVPTASLRWKLAYKLEGHARCRTSKLSGLQMTSYPAEQDAVIETTLADTKKAGLSIFRWLAESGYAKVGPTRVEYFGDGEPAMKVRIIVPVRKRTWARP